MNLYKNSLWIFLEKIIRYFLIFITGPVIARFLGPTEFGKYSLALSLNEIGLPIASMGLSEILIKELSQDQENSRKLFLPALLIKLIGPVIVYSFLYLFTTNYIYVEIQDRTFSYLILLIFGATLLRSSDIVYIYYQAKRKIGAVTVVMGLSILISSCLKLLFVYKKMSLVYFGGAYFSEFLILFIGLTILILKDKESIRHFSFSLTDTKKLLSQCWPLILLGVTTSITLRIDQVFIKHYLGTYQNGLYSAAVKIAEVFYVLPAIATTTLVPELCEIQKNDDSFYEEKLTQILSVTFWGGALLTIIMLCFAKEVIFVLYGNTYAHSINSLKLLMGATNIALLNIVFSHWYVVRRQNKVALYSGLFACIINIVGNYLLIPKFGIEAAAFTTLISYIAMLIAASLFTQGQVGKFYLNAIFRPIKNYNLKFSLDKKSL